VYTHTRSRVRIFGGMAQSKIRLPTAQEVLGSSLNTDSLFCKNLGVMRESNSRPPAPEAGIIPLDQSPSTT
jgi:hypothetical protein